MELTENITVTKLKDKFPDAILDISEFRNEITILVKSGNLHEILRFMKEDRDLGYNFLADMTAVDGFQRDLHRTKPVTCRALSPD